MSTLAVRVYGYLQYTLYVSGDVLLDVLNESVESDVGCGEE
jgi:hypothetical protein